MIDQETLAPPILYPAPALHVPRWRAHMEKLRPVWKEAVPSRMLQWMLDPVWFWTNLGTYEDNPIIFDPWQVADLHDFSRIRFREKAPQIGFSWLRAGEAVWESIMFVDSLTGFVSVNQDEASEKVLYALKLYEGLPDMFRQWVPMPVQNKDELWFGEVGRPSRIMSIPATAALRGRRMDQVVLDEADFYKDGGHDMYRVAIGRVGRSGGRVTLGSTAYGQDCVSPETPVLCADLSWRPAGELEVGDELVAFDEDGQDRRFRTAVVERNEPGVKPSSRVITERGEVTCSSDHPWLVRRPHARPRPHYGTRMGWEWVRTSDLHPEDEVAWFSSPWTPEDSWEAGWLAGVFDGEGGISSRYNGTGWRLNFTQVLGPVLDQVEHLLKERGFEFYTTLHSPKLGTKEYCELQLAGGWPDIARFLGTVQPVRLRERAGYGWEEKQVRRSVGRARVIAVEDVGSQPIASLQTSTRTYIAGGMLCHNTMLDRGMAGLGEEGQPDDRMKVISKARYPWPVAENPDTLAGIELARSTLGEDAFAEEYECRRGGLGGSPFPSKLIQRQTHQQAQVAVIDGTATEGPEIVWSPSGLLAGGFDVGKSRNPSVLSLFEKVPGEPWREIGLIELRQPGGQHYQLVDQQQWLARWLREWPMLVLAVDSKGIGAQLAQALEKEFGLRRVISMQLPSKPDNRMEQNWRSIITEAKRQLESQEVELVPNMKRARQFTRTARKPNGDYEQPLLDKDDHYDLFWATAYAQYLMAEYGRLRSVYNDRGLAVVGGY